VLASKSDLFIHYPPTDYPASQAAWLFAIAIH
jgi:hypothetical protein